MMNLLVRRYVLSIGAIGAIACISGCGGTYDATVSGVVTIDGAIVPNGTVAYSPVAGGPAGYSPIETNGAYVIRTGRENGLPAGEYQVTVTAYEPAKMLQTEKGGPPPPGKALTPAWSRTKDTSGLKFTVNPGSNEINLDLKSQPPAGWKPGARR
jgi:hypothetical protein